MQARLLVLFVKLGHACLHKQRCILATAVHIWLVENCAFPLHDTLKVPAGIIFERYTIDIESSSHYYSATRNSYTTLQRVHHCKKLEVDLTQVMSSQLQSGFILLHPPPFVMVLGYIPCPVKVSSKQ